MKRSFISFDANWKTQMRDRIRRTDLTIVICGEHTNPASGVAAGLTITREEGNPYFLLWGRPKRTSQKPRMALKSDKIYQWTWDTLKTLISGYR